MNPSVPPRGNGQAFRKTRPSKKDLEAMLAYQEGVNDKLIIALKRSRHRVSRLRLLVKTHKL